MPLVRRIPKLKGFRPPHQRVYQTVNLRDLERFDGGEIGVHELRAAGLVKGRGALVKVLGDGEISRRLTIRANAFSRSAKEKIESAGGTVEVIDSKGGPR